VIVFAHAGHWLPQLLYVAPLVVLVVAIIVGRVRERRAGNQPRRDERSD
jgi:cytochrome c oxidase assembly factor CtaG